MSGRSCLSPLLAPLTSTGSRWSQRSWPTCAAGFRRVSWPRGFTTRWWTPSWRSAQAVGQPRVALTGGCFQNRLLTERAAERLARAGFEVLLHRQVPPNDGGISLGQVAVAAARLAVQGHELVTA